MDPSSRSNVWTFLLVGNYGLGGPT
jgi:hypothetical protein